MVYTERRCYGSYRQTISQRPEPSGSPSLGLSVRGFRGVCAPRSGYGRCDPLAAPRVVGGLLRVDEKHRRTFGFSGRARRPTPAEAEALLMPSRYLLDTNTASYIIKGSVPRVRARLLKVPMSQVLISAVTEAELLFGAARKREAVRLKTAIDEFLLRVDSLPWDSNAARRYADLRAALEFGGIPMGNLDMMIAAHALAAEAILVTSDRSFRRLKHLKIEDWTI